MIDNIFVSVIIPTYGRPEFLERAIQSILIQSFKSLEIIVVDDNEPTSINREETSRILKKYDKIEYVRYIQHCQNKNGSAARNTGFYNSSGNYVCFLDDDDEFLPEKLQQQFDFLEKNSLYDACYCKTLFCIDGKVVRRSNFSKQGDFSIDVLMLKNECNTSSFMFRRDAVLKLNGFNEEFIRHQDVEFLVRYFDIGMMGFIDAYLLKRNIDSRINMPSFSLLEKTKQNFLSIFKNKIESYPSLLVDSIYKTHKSDLFFYAIRKKQFKKILQYYPGLLPMLKYFFSNIKKLKSIFILSKTS